MKGIVKKAYDFSKQKHNGQKSISGEDFFKHPRNMYLMLLDRKADDITLCAALLHDVLEDTDTSLEELREEFGEEVAFLVDGMTKIKGFGNYLRKFEECANKDERLLLVKLADLEENISVMDFLRGDEKLRVKEKYTRILDLIKRISKNEKEWAEEVSKKSAAKFKSW